jgi:4-amino-4-deoxy-L-arabinose transferase-like glycosyltransferase
VPKGDLCWCQKGVLVLLVIVAIGPGLRGAMRLTYHEALVAQGAREILESGNWWHPAIGNRPWLEKPPLPFWLVAAGGAVRGNVTPLEARLPSLLATMGLVIGVATLAARLYGTTVGLLSGAIQATTAWTLVRGRLAEADIILACLVTWTFVALARIREPLETDPLRIQEPRSGWRAWRWVFFGLLGLLSLVKGTGFGASLVLSAVMLLLIWERGGEFALRLWFPAGWGLVVALTATWPLLMVACYGTPVFGLWGLHVLERVLPSSGHGPFASEAWPVYLTGLVGQALPWSGLTLIGLGFAGRGQRNSDPPDGEGLSPQALTGSSSICGSHLLWAWTIAPLILVSLPAGRKAHYAIHAQIPWSIWSALVLTQLAHLRRAQGVSAERLRRRTWALFASLGAASGLLLGLVGPWVDERGVEWGFYEAAARQLASGEPLVLLYDDWDRDPYPTPFGPIPHDLAVRLFYLDRPACWHFLDGSLPAVDPVLGPCSHRDGQRFCPLEAAGSGVGAPPRGPEGRSWAAIARPRDLPVLRRFGSVELLAWGPTVRQDRTYVLARVHPRGESPVDP